MVVEVTANNGLKVYPEFDPAHKADVIGFYTKEFWRGDIKGYRVAYKGEIIVEMGVN
jgi:hypothetical protein